jgi:hypothetical protein
VDDSGTEDLALDVADRVMASYKLAVEELIVGQNEMVDKCWEFDSCSRVPTKFTASVMIDRP